MDTEDRQFMVSMFQQFRTDIRSDILTEIRADLNYWFEQVQSRIDAVHNRMDVFAEELRQFKVEVRNRFNGLGDYILSHDRTFLEHAKAATSLEERVNRLEQRVDRLEDTG